MAIKYFVILIAVISLMACKNIILVMKCLAFCETKRRYQTCLDLNSVGLWVELHRVSGYYLTYQSSFRLKRYRGKQLFISFPSYISVHLYLSTLSPLSIIEVPNARIC